ncbi:hypothetical protein VPH35_137038 [Triticum aestivum]
MPQVALVLEVTLFPPLAGVAAAAGAGRTGVAGHPPPRAPGTPPPPPPPPGRGRHVPLVFVLLGDLVAGGGEVCEQVSGTEGERGQGRISGQGLAGGGRIGGQGLAPVLPNEHGAA